MPTDEEKEDEFQPKVVSPKMRRVLQQCYDHSAQLMAKEGYSHDYASKSLIQCVVGDPGNHTYVNAFLNNLQAKYNNNKKGATFGFGGGDKRGFKKAVASKDWDTILKLGPALLEKNPWDVQVLRPMADACEEYFYNDVELRYLKNALDAKPKDIEVNRHCAMSLARMAQFDQAIGCWRRISEIKKNDPEANEMISKLTVDKTKAAGGIESTTSLTPKQRERLKRLKKYKESQAAAALEEGEGDKPATEPAQRTEIQLTERQKLEREIQDFPGEVGNYCKLGELLLAEGRFTHAERVLQKALSVGGAELQIQEQIEECQMAHAAHQVKVAEKQVEENRTEAGKQEAQRLADQLRRDLVRCELGIYESRSIRYPDDYQLKYQVARRLRKIGNYAEAIKRFNEIADQPEYATKAAVETGEAWELLKQYPKAISSYQRAIEVAQDDQGKGKSRKTYAMYRAALLTQVALKDDEAAEKMFAGLMEYSPGYKDTAARLDKLRKMSDN